MKKLHLLIILIVLLSTNLTAFCAETDKSINKTQQQTEIKSIKKTKWYPEYHLAAQDYAMKQPNAITFFNDKYHLFYEDEITTPENKTYTVWGHLTSMDFLNWDIEPTAITADANSEENKVKAGSAIVDNDFLNIVYTDSKENIETINLAMSKDGINFSKSANNPIVKTAPHFDELTFKKEYFRNPYVWKKADRYYALISSQYEKTKDGAVLLYKSKDLRNWVFINVTAIGAKGEMGHIWNSPVFLHYNNEDILLINAYGIKPQGNKYLNKYISGGFIGKLDYNTGNFKQKNEFHLLDYGFDFYAPQIIKTQDDKLVLIASLNMPENISPETEDKWQGMMSIPREIYIENNQIKTKPYPKLQKLRAERVVYNDWTITEEKELPNIKGSAYEIETTIDLSKATGVTLKLRNSDTQSTDLTYNKETQLLTLNRDKSGKDLTGTREVKIPLTNNLLKLNIFVDNSSIEVFADGKALSSRIYPNKTSTNIKFVPNGEILIKNINFYKLINTNI